MAKPSFGPSKFYLKQNVFDAALDRIRWLFDEFENVTVNFSGGKDSTVVLNLCLKVAEEKGRLPLRVLFVDQEAEWQTVVDYVRIVMNDPRVKPLWMQVPIKIFNATSSDHPWLLCWEPGAKWMRPQEPNSIKDNVYGTDRFGEFFGAVMNHDFPGQKAVNIAGVRASESPARRNGLTAYETYKGETWGKARDKKVGHYDMYPLYDWTDTDIWKAIHSNRWEYCRIYDAMYQYGVPMRDMRVSNLHHETAVHVLFYLQEIEGDTWNKLCERLGGINTAKHLQRSIFPPTELPFMFESWREYRDFLLEKLIDNPDHKAWFAKQFVSQDANYVEGIHEKLHKMHIGCILTNDYHGTKMRTFGAANGAFSKNRGGNGGYRGKNGGQRPQTGG